MAESSARLTPEFALVTALETVPALAGKVSALQPPKASAAPFVFYIPTADSEDQDLDGLTGLQHFSAAVHIVAGRTRQLFNLAALVKAAVAAMEGEIYSLNDPGGPTGRVLVEHSRIEQSSPDLYEAEVGLFRRMYTVSFDYQTEDYEEEVVSG